MLNSPVLNATMKASAARIIGARMFRKSKKSDSIPLPPPYFAFGKKPQP